MSGEVLHETARRLRVCAQAHADTVLLRSQLQTISGVKQVRVNARLGCVVVWHDGRMATRAAVLAELNGTARPAFMSAPDRPHASLRNALSETTAWTPALLAVLVPALPPGLRRAGALGVVAARVLTQTRRLRSDAPAVLLDAASLASLAISGQPVVVSVSVLMRLMSERLAARLVRQADELLGHLLPAEAARYMVLQSPPEDAVWAWKPLAALGPGDHIRLATGDVAPVDGYVVDGEGTLASAARQGPKRGSLQPVRQLRQVRVGDPIGAGERLDDGSLEVRAEADALGSRLARMRGHVRHAMHSRDPAGRLAPRLDRLMALPLTASALVLGLTGDTARAAAMLQADPQQGLDLALPLAREATLYALARQGLLTSGLEAIERLATARTLVLQDTGVLASGRWMLEAIHLEPAGAADADVAQVRRWLAALADTPHDRLDRASFPDRVVRQWVRHGAVLRAGDQDIHLASRQRLQQVWGLAMEDEAPRSRKPSAGAGPLRRELAVVAEGRVVAWVILASALRPAVLDHLDQLTVLGFDRIAVFVEADGNGPVDAGNPPDTWSGPGRETLGGDARARADWLAEAASGGLPLVLLHTVLRDLLPPGSLSLSPTEAESGSHGMLLGDPLRSLVAARRVARIVHRRLQQQQGAAVAVNAALMTASALRRLPPIVTALLHHGFVLLLLLDSLRVESLVSQPDRKRQATAR